MVPQSNIEVQDLLGTSTNGRLSCSLIAGVIHSYLRHCSPAGPSGEDSRVSLERNTWQGWDCTDFVALEGPFGSLFDSLKVSEQHVRREKSEITLWVPDCVICGDLLPLCKMIRSGQGQRWCLGTTCNALWASCGTNTNSDLNYSPVEWRISLAGTGTITSHVQIHDCVSWYTGLCLRKRVGHPRLHQDAALRQDATSSCWIQRPRGTRVTQPLMAWQCRCF